MEKSNYDKILEVALKTNTLRTIDDLIAEDSFTNEEMIYYISEPIVKYPEYNIGDIVYVNKFKYKNGDDGENHLFVIIGKENYAVPLKYFCMIISSNLKKLKFKNNVLLKQNNFNKLTRPSLVKTDYVYDFNGEEISGTIGTVKKEVIDMYINIYLNSKEEVYE